jgi:hypothetical protein
MKVGDIVWETRSVRRGAKKMVVGHFYRVEKIRETRECVYTAAGIEEVGEPVRRLKLSGVLTVSSDVEVDYLEKDVRTLPPELVKPMEELEQSLAEFFSDEED